MIRTILLMLVAIGGCACGAAFWDDSENRAPTHDLLQGSPNGMGLGNGPMFDRRVEAGVVDVDADIGAARDVVDAVKGDL